MAFPVILVNSTNGAASDTACSGAGPTTAKTGSAASVAGTATSVSITDVVDLSGVAVDGSACLYYADTTAGHRRFDSITAISGSSGAWTVTVANGYSTSTGPFSWAIGGVRATIAGSVSLLLFSNNSSSGDAMPGWVEEMQSGHAEVITGSIDMRRAGDTTSGPIILRGKSGAATKPKIQVQANVNCIVHRGSYQQCRDFEISAESSAVTTAILATGAIETLISIGIKLSRTSTNVFATGFSNINQVSDCEIQRCGTAISVIDSCLISGNYIHDCTSNGIAVSTASLGVTIVENVITTCGGDGINSGFTGAITRSIVIAGNTIDSCASDGVEFTAAVSSGVTNIRVYNNQLTNNGTGGTGYDIKFSNGAVTLIALQAYGAFIRDNNSYNNATGNTGLPAGCSSTGNPVLNPSYTGGGNYTPTNTSLKGTAYPDAIPGGAGTNYGYPGPITPNSSGGSTVVTGPFPGNG